MSVSSKKRKSALIIGSFIAIATVVYAVALFMNYYTPLTVDDFHYHCNFATNELLSDFSSLVESLKYHYHYINGRIIPHAFVQFFALYSSKSVFNVINAAVFVLLGFLIYKISNTNKPASPIRFLFIYLLMFLLVPAFGQTVLWFDGAINYLWGTTLIVLMLLFFNEKFINPEKYSSIGFLILSIPLSFLAGGWSENTSAVFLMLQVLYGFLYFWTYRKKLPAFYIVDFIVSTISWLLMITAPANAYRRTRIPRPESKIKALMFGMDTCMDMMRRYLYIFIFMLLALMMLGIFIRVSKNCFTNKFDFTLDKNRIFISFFFFIASLTANFVMIAAPYGPRSAFGPVIYMMIAVCMFASCFRIKKFSWIAFVTGVALFICISALTIGAMKSVKAFGTYSKIAENDIIAQVDSGIKDVKGDAVSLPSDYVSNTKLEILGPDPTHNYNIGMAAYYRADTIVVDEVTYLKPTRIEIMKEMIFEWLFG